ncbi:HlyD family secretion protein [Enterovibrio sp. ZSDZ35]|uniref:HlyD family secretion protein n=1 Tax=Enterovibrio qingdaonensis TaxID=2899818 RepID=A0ABT5QKY8_9GAMM|nr:HlyD family secretion protein [Enterovibrio sp. ZSDZ35]MDD1781646.1 HlyD family secretion protein [Enterovibrio sp. ZSDZ35]
MTLKRKLLFFPALAVGVAVLFIALKTRPDIPVKPSLSKARYVDVVTLQRLPIAPEVTGFGRVTPKHIWQAIAEVNGKVIYRHPDLEKGQILAAGTVLLKIDPTDYQIAVAQAEADLNAKQARLARLNLDEKNLKSTLSIEQRRLALSKDELARKRNLQQKGLTSQSALDAEQQSFLSQQSRVQDLDAQLNVLPDDKKITQAELAASELALKQAQRNLEKTEITLPIDSRIADVNIELDQVVTPQQIMLVSHGLDDVEVDAQVSIHDMQTLIDSLDRSDTHTPPLDDLTAKVTLSSGSFQGDWQAQVARLSDTVNLNQATVGVILEIPLTGVTAHSDAILPPLVNGMFVKASIEGQARPHWVIPEQALRGDNIYLLEEGKLRVLPIEVLFRKDDLVAIEGALQKGQVVVLNDILPAVPGMTLRAVTLNGVAVKASNEAKGDAS